MILALAGGVGGAKLAHGLAMRLSPSDLLVVVNTGDDFVHLGLHVSPDVDTVMYWLAERNDPVRGWGLAGESWNFMRALEEMGGPAWFNLGDRDLSTHAERTRLLALGMSLSEVTRHLCERLSIAHRIVPMSDEQLRTIVLTDEGRLEFQHYFVRRRCEPRVLRLAFESAGDAPAPSPAFDAALDAANLEAIVICPSNPFLSIAPILEVQGVRERIARGMAPVIAVSPIVAGDAIKGPAAKIMEELGLEVSALEIARHYRDLIDGLIIDIRDANAQTEIEQLGLEVSAVNTVMKTSDDQAALAQAAIDFGRRLAVRAAA
jgi:LPPG:FO 2-phospho-L-lactate transferase